KTRSSRRWRPVSKRGRRRNPASRTSRAIFSARKRRSWPSCSSWEETPPQTAATSRRLTTTRSDAMIPVPAAAARSTKSAMAKPHSILLIFVPVAGAGIWPDQFGPGRRVSAKPVTLSEQKLWSEYGFQESEQAQYEAGPQKFTAIAYRLQDST